MATDDLATVARPVVTDDNAAVPAELRMCRACEGKGWVADYSDCLGTGELPTTVGDAMTVTFGCRCGEGDCPACGDPRAHVEDMALREEMAAWHEDESPQAVTYQEAILDGADPTEGFYE